MNTKTRKTGARLGALLLSLCLLVGLLPMTAFASDAPIKRNTYNVYAENVINGGSNSQVYAVTIKNVDGADLHYVYSENAIHSNNLMEQIREGLSEPYRPLIPTTFEDDEPFSTGFLCFSENQELYAAMNLDWDNPEDVANTLVSGSGSVSVAANDSAISVTDISVTHADEKVVSEKQLAAEDFYTNPPELGQLGKGEDRVEAMVGVTYRTETVEDKAYYDVFNTMHVAQIYAFTAAKGEEGTAPIKRNDYNVYSENVINGGSDSQVYAVTIKNVDGEDLHYVYSGGVASVIHSEDLMKEIREGLSEPYKSLIPTTFEDDEPFGTGLLYFSRDQEKYEEMSVDWKNPESATNSLISGNGSVNVIANYDAISVTDISELHSDENVVSDEKFSEVSDHYTSPPEFSQLASGKYRVETCTGYTNCAEEIEDTIYYDRFNFMHVTQIYAYTATKAASVSNSISLPVRTLEEGDKDYVSRPDLTAAFTPDIAVTVGEFNQWQGLAIDYYNPMVDAELSEGYDIQAGYTVSIPLTDYEGETLSGTLTIPLPDGYDGASARIKGGASASSYTATTVSFPVTLDISYGTAEASLLIEYKEAQEPVQPPIIIAGANGSWQKSGTDGLSFTSNAAFADFLKVQVDGKDVAASNYAVKEGSTIVTLTAAYLDTLSAGKHTLSIVSANGTATTEFTITAVQGGDDSQTGGTTPQEPGKNEGAVTSPQTGDSSNVVLGVSLLFASGVGLFGAAVYSRKRKYSK